MKSEKWRCMHSHQYRQCTCIFDSTTNNQNGGRNKSLRLFYWEIYSHLDGMRCSYLNNELLIAVSIRQDGFVWMRQQMFSSRVPSCRRFESIQPIQMLSIEADDRKQMEQQIIIIIFNYKLIVMWSRLWCRHTHSLHCFATMWGFKLGASNRHGRTDTDTSFSAFDKRDRGCCASQAFTVCSCRSRCT